MISEFVPTLFETLGFPFGHRFLSNTSVDVVVTNSFGEVPINFVAHKVVVFYPKIVKFVLDFLVIIVHIISFLGLICFVIFYYIKYSRNVNTFFGLFWTFFLLPP